MDKKNEKTDKSQSKESAGLSIKREDIAIGLYDRLSNIKTFLREVRAEFDRIIWPTRKETTAMAIAVLVLTIFFTIFLGLVDMVLGKLVSMVLS